MAFVCSLVEKLKGLLEIALSRDDKGLRDMIENIYEGVFSDCDCEVEAN